MDEIEKLKAQVIDLYAENLAMTAVVTSVFRRLALEPEFRERIKFSLRHAEEITEAIALRTGKSAKPEHTIGAMKIVDGLSKIILSLKI